MKQLTWLRIVHYETDVYVCSYALLVVHVRKDADNQHTNTRDKGLTYNSATTLDPAPGDVVRRP